MGPLPSCTAATAARGSRYSRQRLLPGPHCLLGSRAGPGTRHLHWQEVVARSTLYNALLVRRHWRTSQWCQCSIINAESIKMIKNWWNDPMSPQVVAG